MLETHHVIALIISCSLLTSAPALAHTMAELCDVNEDIAAQCADAHDCVTRPEVSDTIGYCKGGGEDISFAMCDQRRGDEDCATGDRCLIGTIDPHIGVCVTGSRVEPTFEPEPDMGASMDMGTPQDEEPTCQSIPTRGHSAPPTLLLAAMCGAVCLVTRRTRRRS